MGEVAAASDTLAAGLEMARDTSGQPGEALALHTTALELAADSGNRLEQITAHRGLAEAYSATGAAELAERHRRAASDLGPEPAIRSRQTLASA